MKTSLVWPSVINGANTTLLLTWLAYSLGSTAFGAYRRYRGGQVRLDPGHPNSPPQTRRDDLYAALLDRLATDLHQDGDAVDEPGFWRQIRVHKCMIQLSTLITFGVQVNRVVRSARAMSSWGKGWDLAAETGIVAWIVTASLSVLLASSVQRYRDHLYTVFFSSALLSLHVYIDMMSSLVFPGINEFAHPWPINVHLGAALVTMLLTGTIAQEPASYRDRTRLYNHAVADKLNQLGGDVIEPNVIGNGRSIIGRFLSTYMFSIVGNVIVKDQVDLHELPALPGHMQAEATTRHAVECDSNHGVHHPASLLGLFVMIWRPQKGPWFKTIICIIGERIIAYIPFYCLKRIIGALDGDGSRQAAWAFASLYLVCLKLGNFSQVYRMWDIGLLGISRAFRTHLNYLLFRKLLTRNVHVKPPTSTDKSGPVQSKPDIMNLISSDMEQLSDLIDSINNIAQVFLSAGVGCLFVWSLLGVSALWGIGASFLAYPPAYLLSRLELRLFERSRTASDGRVEALQETVQTISMIKMMGYELFNFRRLNSLRQKEFRYQFLARTVGFISAALYSTAPAVVVVIAFAHYTLVAGNTLTASIAFTSIAVFAELRVPLTMAPRYIADLFKEFLAIKRIFVFLRSDDVECLSESVGTSLPTLSANGPYRVVGDISWHSHGPEAEPSAAPFALRDLDISFERAKITLIAGKAGAGKTLLLNGILGEVRCLRGHISYAMSSLQFDDEGDAVDWSVLVDGVAYVPQTAWLQSMSIRDNILFGLPMQRDRYRSVLQACALLPDLRLMEDSDLTEIGERGKTLSGGQKARVSLARAMYSRASTLVLDDVLSAVDPPIVQHILRHCLVPACESGRTVVVASHAVETLAPISHQAIFLDDGTCAWTGPGPELLQTEHMRHLVSNTTLEAANGTAEDRNLSFETTGQESDTFEIRVAPPKTPRQILVDEKRSGGAVESRYWSELIRMCGGKVFLATFALLTVGSVLGPVAERGTIQKWTEDPEHAQALVWVAAYAIASTTAIVLSVGQEYAGYYGGFKAMQKTYAVMLDRVLRSPMLFFVRTRAGSIVQRFSGDLDNVTGCSELLGELVLGLCQVTISVGSISFFIGWQFVIVIIVLSIVFRKPAQSYRLASRQVRRLMSILPGPVNAHFGETLTGAPVIRAFGVQGIHVQQMIRLTNMYETSLMLSYMIGRWSWVCTEVFDFLVLAAALSAVLSVPGMTGAQAGFVMGFAQTITSELNWLVVCMRDWDLKGVMLERLAEFRNLDTEAIPPFVQADGEEMPVEHDEVETTWPDHGHIVVSGLSARYGPDLPNVLSNVSFSIDAGERVGIVGASGCGKSTLAKAFFSFVDIVAGKIKIDGIDLHTLPLHIARGRLGIIGQDPMLVTGSLRINLDIDGSHKDDELFEALRHVQLLGAGHAASERSETSSTTAIESMPDVPFSVERNRNVFEDLDYKIINAGENLSTGQKQLVVLARAFLQRKKVLILDEATASVDTATDQLLTRLVHEEFHGSTILIIAHRLRTIMPCDRILVMDNGRVIESGSPVDLLQRTDGAFKRMCMAAGEDEFRQLAALAIKPE